MSDYPGPWTPVDPFIDPAAKGDPGVRGKRTIREGDYLVTYRTVDGDIQGELSRVYSPVSGGTSATSTGATPPAGATPNAPPAGANPDEQVAVYENGRIMRTTYKYTANGHTAGDTIKDYTAMWAKLDSVQTAPDFTTWLTQSGYGNNFQSDITKSTPYQGITDLIAKLNDPNTPIADRQAALDQLAKERGYATGTDYNTAMNQWNQNLQAGPANQQGMTPEEKLAYQKLSAGQTQELESQQRKQLDAIMSGQTGNSTARALMQANENIKTIRDAQLQSTVSLMNMDYARKLDAFDRNAQLYKDAMDRGEMTTQQFMQAFKDNRLSALQGFATQTSTILQQNQQYLNMYGQDLDKIRTNADIVYQQIQVELGIDEAAATAVRDAFDKWAAQEGLRLTQAQIDINSAQGILGVVMILAGIISAIFIPALGIALVAGGTVLAGS